MSGTAAARELGTGADEIRRLYGSNLPFLFPRLEDRLRRWLRVPPQTVRAATVAGAAGVTARLMSAMVATAFAGVWSDVPWGRWAVILVWYAVFDATQSWRTPRSMFLRVHSSRST